ncbi:MAG: hypothetical protein NW226_18465 [Microscillaceae bacterium]|nr:hypothetical protein [Microscillaceae bacterium]
MNKDKLTLVLDADRILQAIKEKYGEQAVVSEKGKKAKDDLLKNGSIWNRIPKK